MGPKKSASGGGGGKKEEKDKTEPCLVCSKAVGETGIKCEICKKWEHVECADMTDDVYKFMSESRNAHWFCDTCNAGIEPLLEQMAAMQIRQDRMEKELDTVKGDIVGIKKELRDTEVKLEIAIEAKLLGVVEKKMESRVADTVKDLKRNVDDTIGALIEAKLVSVKKGMDDVESKLASKVADVKKDVSENLEIEKRKHNIVIHGVKEDTGSEEEFVQRVLGDGLKMDPRRHIEEVQRIGAPGSGKVRPIRVKLKSLEARIEILKRAKSLKDHEAFKKVYISPDLTREQQLLDKDLRDKVKSYRNHGEPGAKIKGGKIIKIDEHGDKTILFDSSKK